MEKLKLYCIFARESLDEMKGVRGKMTSMAGHAFLHTVWDAMDRFPDVVAQYRESPHAYKISLVVPTVADLEVIREAYRDKCGVSLVVDAGFTVFKNEDGTPCPTKVCLGLGPIPESLIGDDLKALKTLT